MELSLTEMLMILFVALLVYGGRLPKVAMSLGRILGEFKKGLKETSDLVRYEVESLEEPRVRRRAPREEPEPEDPSDIYGDLQEDPEPTAAELAKQDITLDAPDGSSADVADDSPSPVESPDPA